jgi:hypothetical protein
MCLAELAAQAETGAALLKTMSNALLPAVSSPFHISRCVSPPAAGFA